MTSVDTGRPPLTLQTPSVTDRTLALSARGAFALQIIDARGTVHLSARGNGPAVIDLEALKCGVYFAQGSVDRKPLARELILSR